MSANATFFNLIFYFLCGVQNFFCCVSARLANQLGRKPHAATGRSLPPMYNEMHLKRVVFIGAPLRGPPDAASEVACI